jgi:hypothetical protein
LGTTTNIDLGRGRRGAGWFPRSDHVRMQLRALAPWSRRFEVPDVVDYADYAAEPDESLTVFRMVPAADPEPLRFLKYPKGNGGFRSMALATPRELVYLRVAAGYIGLATGGILGPEVYSGKFGKMPPDWTLRPNAYTAFQMGAAARATAWGCELMVRTDMQGYYGSIPVERLAPMLIDAKALYGPTAFFLERVMWWQDHCKLQGLPVGLEACGIPGTAYLAPLDGLLRELAVGFYRYTDDVIYFSNRGALFDEVDALVESLGLQRSRRKTDVFSEPDKARDAIRRRSLDYLGVVLDVLGEEGLRKVRGAFEEEVAQAVNVDVTSYRWLLRTLGNHGDSFAADTLLNRIDLLNIDPRTAGEYLRKAGLKVEGAIDRVVEAIGSDCSEDTDALRVHLMKLASGTDCGRTGREVFETVAESTDEPPEVRAWAWMAAARSDGFAADRAFEAAMEERDELVSRAGVLTMRGKDVRSKKWLTNDYARRHPANRPAAAWAGAA